MSDIVDRLIREQEFEAADEIERLRGLLREVKAHVAKDGGLPMSLVFRIDAALSAAEDNIS